MTSSCNSASAKRVKFQLQSGEAIDDSADEFEKEQDEEINTNAAQKSSEEGDDLTVIDDIQ